MFVDIPLAYRGGEATRAPCCKGLGDVTAIEAEPDLVASCVEVAATVSDPEGGAVAGAVYRPELEIVPETADQVTAEL
jgi:hypothetical protein